MRPRRQQFLTGVRVSLRGRSSLLLLAHRRHLRASSHYSLYKFLYGVVLNDGSRIECPQESRRCVKELFLNRKSNKIPAQRSPKTIQFYFFSCFKEWQEIPTLRVWNCLSCATFDGMVAGPTDFRNNFKNGCSQESKFIMKKSEKVRNNDAIGCPRRSIGMLAISFRQTANKLIYDSPANLSLTA